MTKFVDVCFFVVAVVFLFYLLTEVVGDWLNFYELNKFLKIFSNFKLCHSQTIEDTFI